MACNCASKEQIEELFKIYGQKKDTPKGDITWFRIKKTLMEFGVKVCLVLLAPIVFMYIVYKFFSKNNKISIATLFNLKNRNINDIITNYR